jgi:hypothetical protein
LSPDILATLANGKYLVVYCIDALTVSLLFVCFRLARRKVEMLQSPKNAINFQPVNIANGSKQNIDINHLSICLQVAEEK